MPPQRPARPDSGQRAAESGRVLRLPVPESDAALVRALRAEQPGARDEFVRRMGDHVERVLYRILGPDPELEDLAHDVFLAALGSLDKLRTADRLRSWMVGIAVNKARKAIQRRRQWRFVLSVAPNELPEREAPISTPEVSEALRATYRVLERLPADERIAFALRHIEGMDLNAVAEATEVSLATAKRRLARAHTRFTTHAERSDVLAPWLASGRLEA